MREWFVYVSILFALYTTAAFATTDIIRLLAGSELSHSARNCYCASCGTKIPLWRQIPIFSYIQSRGVCHVCGAKIPRREVFLEIFLFGGMALLAAVTQFSWVGYWLDVLLYQGTKVVFLIHFGIRKKRFVGELIRSICWECFVFLMIAFLYWIVNWQM